MDVLTAAFREYAGVELKKKQSKKPSVQEKSCRNLERKAKQSPACEAEAKIRVRTIDAGKITEDPGQTAGDLKSPIFLYFLCSR